MNGVNQTLIELPHSILLYCHIQVRQRQMIYSVLPKTGSDVFKSAYNNKNRSIQAREDDRKYSNVLTIWTDTIKNANDRNWYILACQQQYQV